MPTSFRPATADDIDAVLAFWVESAQPTSTDSRAALTSLLRHDPGALIVAEADGHIVGSVIAGWDGWRGSIYRLAVGPDQRRRGLGRALLQSAEDRLRDVGAQRLHAIVDGSSNDALSFWTATAWEHRDGQLRFTRGEGTICGSDC